MIMNKPRAALLINLGFITAFVCAPSAGVWAQSQPDAAQLAALQPIDAATAPKCATFWLMKGRDPDHPSPPLPGIPTALRVLNLQIYSLGGNSFLIDDRGVDYAALDEAGQVTGTIRMLESQDDPGFPDADDGGDSSTNDPPAGYPPGSLWLALAMTNDPAYGNLAVVTLNGTTNEVWYEILSKRSLTDPDWWSEGSLPGCATQATSQASVTADGTTSNLFLCARALTNGSGSTLPIDWQLQNFGRTGLDPASAPGSQGISLLESYLQGTEPNLIRFSLSATNNYIKASPAFVQLGITGGIPFYQAVLVDSTNSTFASWSACTSTNLSVDLGSVEGWHDVWVGLKGLSASSHPTWEWKRLKLDFTPPQLSLLSPAEGVVTPPTIQLVGSCPEALSAIWYDLSNAAGLWPDQQVLILDRYQDTNTWEFTTTTFQAFDVNLVGGTNVVTLHATDLAGNQTVTNFAFILDYSNKTNAPALRLVWPQDGTPIGAGTFTLHGWTDDTTATVQAQVTGVDGRVCTFLGLVERTGQFWVDNLRLAGGTNTVALTLTDAAGNSSSTNISVIQSAVLLTMNPVMPASQLWQPTVDVNGTISDPAYAVWVNGVKASCPGDGTWGATDVPVTSGSTAVFQMTGYSPQEQQPDGSHGR
jgi:hypothetical protein